MAAQNSTQPIDALVVFISGPSCWGKTTKVQFLARRFRTDPLDADDYHTKEAKAKMGNKIPLTDEDRRPWLQAVSAKAAEVVASSAKEGEQTRLAFACSALKKDYRDTLRQEILAHSQKAGLTTRVIFIFPALTPEEAVKRSERRQREQGHYMTPEMIDSQYKTYEEPVDEPDTLVYEADDLSLVDNCSLIQDFLAILSQS